MSKFYIVIISLLLFAACKKDGSRSPLADGSVAISTIGNVDTVVRPLSVLKDTPLVIGLTAEVAGKASSSSHWVSFAVDTSKLIGYRAKYGNAMLLPTSSYFFYKSMVQIPAGAIASDSIQLNIVDESQLTGDTTYVLPVVIASVDGNPEGGVAGQVVYLVFKTGDPAILPKSGWTISAYSSYNGTFTAANAIDKDDVLTYWVSNINQSMPQYFTVSFNKTLTFSSLSYYFPPALKYPTNGGYPTSIQIETSMDGVNWVNDGVFAGNLVNNVQTLSTGTVTAAFMRFTSLACVKYAATYNVVFISGIELMP